MAQPSKKLWFGSDFHMESGSRMTEYKPDKELFDGLLLAGDMSYSWRIEECLEQFKHLNDFVVFTPGNHEFWDRRKEPVFMDGQIKHMRDVCRALGVHFLYNSSVRIPGTKHAIWGSPWFTDYARSNVPPEEITVSVGDYYCTLLEEKRRLAPKDHVLMNKVAQAHLEAFLIECSTEGLTPIILTHFGPCTKSNHPGYPDDQYAHYFVTDYLDKNHEKFPPGSVWIHGHTHHNVDYMIGNVRVASNQVGYKGESHSNFTYDPMKYLEVPSCD